MNGGLNMQNDFIKEELNKYKQVLEKQIEKLSINEPIIIDENFLFNKENKSKEAKASMGSKNKLDKIKNSPVLYWITFENEACTKAAVYNLYSKTVENLPKEFKTGKEFYSEKELTSRRVFSSYKSKNEHDFTTQTLYVGKVENNIWGRLAVHSGWGTSPKTAGLQLRYWYDFQSHGNLTFNYIVFDNQLKYFVEVLEKELRDKLNPLLGKK